jgi:hypothetical protein
MGRELKRVPPDNGFQMWQTVSDEPYTPVFGTAKELAKWCAEHPWGAELDDPITYDVWLKFINGPGWAPSMCGMSGNVKLGVVGVVELTVTSAS